MRLLEVPVLTLEAEINELLLIQGIAEHRLLATGAIIALASLVEGTTKLSELITRAEMLPH